MDYPEIEIGREDVFHGKILTAHVDTVQLVNGKTAFREVVDHNGGVGIVPVDEEGNVYLVRQFRYPIGESILEIPAGKLEKGEDPFSCAVRELSEETGFTAEHYVDLGSFYPSPGFCREKLYLYLATGLKAGKLHLDEDEFLDVVKLPFVEAVELALSPDMKDAKTVMGILRAAPHLK